MTDRGTLPLPSDPALAKVAVALRDSGHWAWVVDPEWRLVYMTDEIRRTFGGGELAALPLAPALHEKS